MSFEHLLDILFVPICIQIGALIVGSFLSRLINRYLQSNVNRDSWQYIFVNALKGLPISWCSGVGLYWTINSLSIPETISRLLSYLLFAVIIFTLTRVIARTLSGMIDFYTMRSDQNMPKTSLLNNLINILVYSMGALIVLQYCGISVAPILTALGVGGMAVALGLQDTLANIFAGLHLILSKQLRLNDYIKLSTGEEGRVSDITWRFTTLQSVSNNVVVVPNQSISKAIITNYILSKLDPEVKAEPVVRFNLFADSSINFNVIMHVSEFTNQYIVKHEFIKAITKEFRKENIEIPFPVRTIINNKE